MRLINTKSLQLHDFSLAEIPPYAILSHTWGDSEVTFQDLSLPQSQRVVKKGYVKVEKTCELALKDGLGFAWIDTCCIDKSSSAELTESINSMFQWYKAAELCYIALEDLEPGTTYEAGFPKCRWFTRGWTLQELLAPRTVEFYDMGWNHRGSRLDFTSTIARITSIPTSLLRGDSDVADYSVAERMSWAACRQTTRVEDVGYCLLGIFDVNMPLIYGEGTKAFRRLQEEIVKRNNDLTIFAWESPSQQSSHFSLFAHSPEAFADSAGIVPFSNDFLDFSISNKGLLRSGESVQRIAFVKTNNQPCRDVVRYLINLGTRNGALGGIYLRKIGPNVFYRDRELPLAGFGRNLIKQVDVFDATDYYILLESAHKMHQNLSACAFRLGGIHIPFHSDDTLTLCDVVPTALWDASDRIFLRPKPYTWSGYPMVLATAFKGSLANSTVSLVVLCDCRSTDRPPVCKLAERSHLQHEAEMIFNGRHRHESTYWADLELLAPRVLKLSHSVDVKVGHQVFTISVSLVQKMVEIESWEVKIDMFDLVFEIVPRKK